MLSMETLVSLPAYVHEHDLHIRPYSLRRGYLYGTNTPAVVRERGVLCRRAIIHVELRTRRVARHGDRRRNDRARCGNQNTSESPISRLADAVYIHACTPRAATAKVDAYLHDTCTISTCVESPAIAPSLETLTMYVCGRKNRWKIRLTL